MIERVYAIIPVTEISKLNFNEILQNSKDTLRYSLDKSKVLIKWDEQEPSFLNDLQNLEGPYSQEQIIKIINSTEWTEPFVLS